MLEVRKRRSDDAAPTVDDPDASTPQLVFDRGPIPPT
jgi:hypothetical protein